MPKWVIGEGTCRRKVARVGKAKGYVMMKSIIESCLSMIILFVQKLLYSGVRPKEAISRPSHVLFPFASERLQVLFVLNVMAMLLLLACVVCVDEMILFSPAVMEGCLLAEVADGSSNV
ncbi:hypothetical protein RHSIM_Rhsim09G0061100 [Rhododendron simsii]|uniref:Uncharacterized protein n=1 Tax=Rhododendron simsii TaxID=118357 RepID=A0A834GCH1_RHOSS|nr:hypothetical protein RHSIM_Rhsim09G0061100 [Rhododendron simsii]